MDTTTLLNQLAGHDVIALIPRPRGHDPGLGQSALMTTDEVARLLRKDPSTLRRWRTARPLQGPPFIRLSDRLVMYRAEDVQNWLGGRRVDPEAA